MEAYEISVVPESMAVMFQEPSLGSKFKTKMAERQWYLVHLVVRPISKCLDQTVMRLRSTSPPSLVIHKNTNMTPQECR